MLAPQLIEDEDLTSVVVMDNSVFFYYKKVSIIMLFAISLTPHTDQRMEQILENIIYWWKTYSTSTNSRGKSSLLTSDAI